MVVWGDKPRNFPVLLLGIILQKDEQQVKWVASRSGVLQERALTLTHTPRTTLDFCLHPY